MKTILAVVAVIVSLFFIIDALWNASFIGLVVFAFMAAFSLMIVKAVRNAL